MAEPTTGTHAHEETERGGIARRKFLTWMVAAPVLTVGAKAALTPKAAQAQVPKLPQVAEFQDLGEQLQLANLATEHMVKLEVLPDSTVRMELHRTEVGQGIATAVAMLIADEMEIPLEQVDVVLRDAAPELIFNQLTGGSASMRHLYRPVRQAAAAAKNALVEAAAREHDVDPDDIEMRDGRMVIPGLDIFPIGAFTALAANFELPTNSLQRVKSFDEQGPIIGTPTRRIDGLDIVTGRRTYALDVPVENAATMMVRRAPTIMGTPRSVRNRDEVLGLSGVIDLIELPRGIGVIAETFGQAEVAKNALDVEWNGGTIDGQDDDDIFDGLRRRQLPLAVPGLGNLLGNGPVRNLDFEFSFPFVSHAPLETNSCTADVRDDTAELWASMKIPIIALQDTARVLGMREGQVTAHVMPGGGSFGRRLFHDAVEEAALASQQVGRPVRNLWTRLDDMRHGRGRAPSVHRLRVTMAGDNVLTYEHRMSGIAASAEHGLGEAITAIGGRAANLAFAQDLFLTLIKCPYDFGIVTELLIEPNQKTMNTGSWRSPYSNTVRSSEEVAIDEIAASLEEDPLDFRLRMVTADRGAAVLRAVAEAGEWGKDMPAGFAQGISYHEEYNSYAAWLVEIDARDESDPRITKAIAAVDVGNPINPSGLEQQMLGCLADGIGVALRLGNHVQDGAIVESSYSDFKITKARHFPTDTKVIVMPASTDDLGGAGELGVAGATAAVANAFARATGRQVRSFPVNFDIDFDVVPEVPAHPTFDA